MKRIRVEVWVAPGRGMAQPRFCMTVEVDDREIIHDRTNRDYASPGDALTSARHLINEIQKGAKR